MNVSWLLVLCAAPDGRHLLPHIQPRTITSIFILLIASFWAPFLMTEGWDVLTSTNAAALSHEGAGTPP